MNFQLLVADYGSTGILLSRVLAQQFKSFLQSQSHFCFQFQNSCWSALFLLPMMITILSHRGESALSDK
jgi:hypothetical protein